MKSLVKKLWNMFKPLKHINRITLVNYAAMIIIIILVTLFWKNREGFYDNNGMDAMNAFLDGIIERNRQDITLITNSSLNSENAQQLYSIWKGRTTTSIQNYIGSYIDYYGNARVSGVNSHMYNRALPDAGIKSAARLNAINTFTSNLPSSPWPYGLAVGSAGYKDYITSTTYRDDIGGVAGATTGTSPAETGAVTGTFGGIVATGSITRNDSGGFVGCTFTISSAGINGNFIGGGGQCTFAGGIVIGGTLTGGTLTGGTLTGNTLTGGTITSTSTSTSTGGTFTNGSITGVNCSLTGGTLTGILTGITTITGVTVTGNAIAGGNITGTFSGTFARAPSIVNEFMFRVPQTTATERTTFNSKLTNIETEINILLTRWFQNHPNDDFTFANIVNDTATSSSTPSTSSSTPSTSSSYSPSNASTDIVSGQGTSTSNANQSALIGQLYNTELLVGNVNTGMSPVAEYWKNKYYEQITRTGTNIARNSSMPYGPTGNEAAFWKQKYEEQINGARSGSILPYNSSTSYNLLNDGSTLNPTASNATASKATASNAESANNSSCSAATDDMYMLKSKMVYMNPTQGKTDSNTSKTDSNASKTDSTKSNQNNYADSRDTKQAPYPPCPACDRCPEPAFDCKKVPNYKSVAINQYLPQPVLSSFAQFGM